MLVRPPRSFRMTLNLAPLVDVMMCLIIFFLLASKLATDLRPVELPWARSARAPEPGDLGDAVTVTVLPAAANSAEYIVNDWDGRRIVERRLHPEDIDALLQTRAARAAREGTPLRCIVRADRQVRYRDVEVVLRGCGLAQIEHVVFPANRGQPPEDAK